MATPIKHRQPWRAGWTGMLITALCRGVLAMLVSLLVWSLVPVALGWHVTVVMSGSMEPALRPGDVVASRPVPAQQVRPGQVLLVDDPDHAGRLRLHRLAKIHRNGTLTLRGDANPADDSTPVRRNAVHGVGALRVPFVGAPAYWARTHQMAPLAGGGVILLLLLASACARRENDDEDDESPEDTGDGSATAPLPDAIEPDTEVDEHDSDIRRAAFAGRPGWLVGIGVLTFGLIGAGIATGPAALAAPFTATTSTSSSWAAATSFGGCSPAVMADKPYAYYRLAETSGTTAADASGNGRNGTYSSTGVSHTGNGGPCSDTPAVTTLNGSGMISTSQRIAAPGPTTFTEEIWFRTTDYRGGSLIGYAATPTGTPTQYDRQLYLTNSAQLVFGVYTGSVKTIMSAQSYNDGAWHLATAALSSAGMKLYVDGHQVAADASVTTAESAAGYWRIGSSNFSGWPSAPTSQGFIGTVSGAAVYSTALSAARITAHYDARS